MLQSRNLTRSQSLSKATEKQADGDLEVVLLAMTDQVQASLPKEVHDLPFLLRLHAREDHNIGHDQVQERVVPQLQHVLEGCTRHTALGFSLHPATHLKSKARTQASCLQACQCIQPESKQVS